jgi:membrane associated rhomboid family serine protease
MQEYRPSSFKLLPDVVKNILIICALAFFADMVFTSRFNFSVNNYFGLHIPASPQFYWWQFITYLFLHGSWTHIIFNMLAFWMFGNTLENLWGPKRFLIFFLVTGIGAGIIQTSIATYSYNKTFTQAQEYVNNPTPDGFFIFLKNNPGHWLLDPLQTEQLSNFKQLFYKEPNNPSLISETKQLVISYSTDKINTVTVGASGAVFGILLAFGMLFPNTIIYIYFAFPIKAKYFVVLYGLLEVYLGIQNNSSDNVAHFAHLGGMLFGFILIKIWSKRRDTFY